MPRGRWWHRAPAVPIGLLMASVGVTLGLTISANPPTGSASDFAAAKAHIRHVVVIMQENRSFDSYFGTFPGADGIPVSDGRPLPCVPDSERNRCQRPYVDHADVNGGGPHGAPAFVADVDGGRMDGFVNQADRGARGCLNYADPACTNSATPDVMGYHTRSDIPNYWTYASDFVLQDHMFEPNASWSLPEHLFQVSEWSAFCPTHAPSSCVNALQAPGSPPGFGAFPWTRDPGRHPAAHLRLDRPHLPPPPRQGLMGLLRRRRHRT